MKKIIATAYSLFFLKDLLNRRFVDKKSANIISGMHALSAIFLSGSNQIKTLRWTTSSYFVYDFCQMFFSKKLDLPKLLFMYHHLSGIYLLTCDSREIPLQKIFFWSELSNLANYPLYHYLHEKPQNEKKIILFRKLQKYLYCGIRMPIMTFEIYKMIKKGDVSQKNWVVILSMYMMGLLWSGKIISQ